ncbi:MAG: sugar phosphate isomerase/epimerase [Acidobacteriales bacterium]|nr:sugar phosphate isomerase/epimerase [Terriglobales bacterium]
MDPKLPLAAITDEFSPNLDTALEGMAGVWMTGAELRMVSGKNIMDLTDDEVAHAKAAVEAKGMKVISIASPLLKVVLPEGGRLDHRFEQDGFAAKHTMADQPRLTRRAFDIAHMTGARIIRVFSFWRTVEPEKCFDRIAEALLHLAESAAKEDLIIGLENEQACNVATGSESAVMLEKVKHPNLGLVWDPGNCEVSGEHAFPDGYRKLPADRIVHVHAKDVRYIDGKAAWGLLGAWDVDWKGQIRALLADGYRGWVSLETHWPGPGGDKFQASVICGWNLRELLAAS